MKIFLPFLIAFFTLTNARADINLPHDGSLRLFHSHSGEYIEAKYESGGQLIPSEIKKINHFMRSRDSGEILPLSSDLIILLDHLQDHFDVDTVEVICGYRSEKFNKDLKKSGHNVANESFHTKGLAADIHLDEIQESDLKNYLLKLNLGGVGYYPDLLMVHADFGPKRTWQDGQFTDRKNIGIFNKESSAQIQTNHLFYTDIDQQVLITRNTPPNAHWSLEFFHRGEWIELLWWNPDDKALSAMNSTRGYQLIDSLTPAKKLEGRISTKSGLPLGKYRWVVDGSIDRQYSNEFYIKKKPNP